MDYFSYPGELDVQRAVVALGVFDGVHLGHQAVLRCLAECAECNHAVPVALFFTPHPREVLQGQVPMELTSREERVSLLKRYGAQKVVAMPFTRELSGLAPREFMQRYFADLEVEFLGFCVGEDWRFGAGNSGTPATLTEWAGAHHAEVRVIPPVLAGGKRISSSRIRQEIQAGHLQDASRMLGRPVAVFGKVVHGWRNGHEKTRIPTANLTGENQPLPPDGVYVAAGEWEGHRAEGIVYVGDAPTLRKNVRVRLVELHLFDAPERELYGQQIKVEFLKFLRESRCFPDAEALAHQIREDICNARDYFRHCPGGDRGAAAIAMGKC